MRLTPRKNDVVTVKWKEAPDWSRYAAQDRDGCWHWYEFKPIIEYEEDEHWWPIYGNVQRMMVCCEKNIDWKSSLQRKPDIL